MTSSYTEIAYEVEDRIALITLDRPEKLNALTDRMVEELLDAIDRVDGDDNVRVAIVTGRGRGFCAGADLRGGTKTFDTYDGGASEQFSIEEHADGGGLVALRIWRSLKPFIAAINGPAVGVGATITLPMDIRIAAEGARIGFVFARRGVVPESCSSWFLPRVVGISHAAEWAYSGRLIETAEALDAGLVRSVHPQGDLLAAARELAQGLLADSAPVATAISRWLLWHMLSAESPEEAHRIESEALFSLAGGPDGREGVAAFLEKRPAAFPLRVSADLPAFFERLRGMDAPPQRR